MTRYIALQSISLHICSIWLDAVCTLVTCFLCLPMVKNDW